MHLKRRQCNENWRLEGDIDCAWSHKMKADTREVEIKMDIELDIATLSDRLSWRAAIVAQSESTNCICTAYMQYIMHAMNTEQLSIYIKGSPTTHINICYLKIVIGANRSGVSNRFSSEGVEKTRFYHPAIGSRSLITNLATIKTNSFWPCCMLEQKICLC